MGWQSTPYLIPIGIGFVIVVGLLALTVAQRSQKGAYTMMGLFGSIALFAGGYGLQLASTNPGQALFWNTVRFLGVSFSAFAFLVFALQYTGREGFVTRRNVALLAVVPVLTNALLWTEYLGLYHLVRPGVRMTTVGGLERLEFGWGPWRYVHAVYSIQLTLLAIGLFTDHWRSATGPTIRRAQFFTLAGLLPVLGTTMYAVGITTIDWGPVSYVLTAVLLVVAIFRY